MKQINTISEGTHYTAINIGALASLQGYGFEHPKRHQLVTGKVFTGNALKSKGAEISFTTIPGNSNINFYHKHKKHEEIYIFLKGEGQFQVDGTTFNVSEGSVVRVSPEGNRAYRSISSDDLVFICIQTLEGSLDNYMVEDGYRGEGEPVWEK